MGCNTPCHVIQSWCAPERAVMLIRKADSPSFLDIGRRLYICILVKSPIRLWRRVCIRHIHHNRCYAKCNVIHAFTSKNSRKKCEHKSISRYNRVCCLEMRACLRAAWLERVSMIGVCPCTTCTHHSCQPSQDTQAFRP